MNANMKLPKKQHRNSVVLPMVLRNKNNVMRHKNNRRAKDNRKVREAFDY